MHCIVFIDNVRAEPSGSDLLNHINRVGQGKKDYSPYGCFQKEIHKTVKIKEPTHFQTKSYMLISSDTG